MAVKRNKTKRVTKNRSVSKKQVKNPKELTGSTLYSASKSKNSKKKSKSKSITVLASSSGVGSFKKTKTKTKTNKKTGASKTVVKVRDNKTGTVSKTTTKTNKKGVTKTKPTKSRKMTPVINKYGGKPGSNRRGYNASRARRKSKR